ncbi:hypothetical protein SAMN02745857_02160 [Andreprevotia lacus DSM 23236]|uniref:MAPEG family protein n=1 Tax=Andreprevotia lacus DSM 23236 TaxID=1121001 RepID=A0A1W1XNC9_9NEIS|nr:MAPEG family protein [Andreprevotia lacus]SMC25416.1 hypothetical protein SAMN02745857_02160 [Andreprevotia lacus DSM 23236]
MLAPVLVMFLLTFVVWLLMYERRFRYMMAERIHPQRIATPESLRALLPDSVLRPADNLRNLFELPVIFYAACAIALALHLQDGWLHILAWGFVLGRVVHSAIHCTINRVPARFAAYSLSAFLLWGLVLRLAWLAA